MIIIELPHTSANNNTQGYLNTASEYLNILDIYKKWFRENNIPFDIEVRGGKNDLVTISEQDATMFRLKFGV